MWTKFVNWLGFETQAQKEEFRQAVREFNRATEAEEREIRAEKARARAAAVIASPGVPKKKTTKIPTKPSGAVRQERYGYSDQDNYLNPANAVFYDAVMDSYDSNTSCDTSTVDSSSGGDSSSSYDPTPSTSSDSGSSYSSDYSSSYDSGSSFDSGGSSCDSGSW